MLILQLCDKVLSQWHEPVGKSTAGKVHGLGFMPMPPFGHRNKCHPGHYHQQYQNKYNYPKQPSKPKDPKGSIMQWVEITNAFFFSFSRKHCSQFCSNSGCKPIHTYLGVCTIDYNGTYFPVHKCLTHVKHGKMFIVFTHQADKMLHLT